MADTSVSGQMHMAGSHFVGFVASVLPYEKIRTWYLPPVKPEDEYETGNDDAVRSVSLIAGKIADAVVEAKEGNLTTADDEESETMQELVEKEGIDKIERKPKQNNRRNYTRRNDKKEEATEEVKAEEVAEETETTEE